MARRRQFKPVRLRLERHPDADRTYTFGPDLDGHPRFYVIPNPIPGRGAPWFLLDRGDTEHDEYVYTIAGRMVNGRGRAFPSLGAIREAYSTAEAQRDAGIISRPPTRRGTPDPRKADTPDPRGMIPLRFTDKKEAERLAVRLSALSAHAFTTVGDGVDGSAGWLVVLGEPAR